MHDPDPLRAILHRALAKYLTVTARGIVLAERSDPRLRVTVRVLGFGGARTLYEQRKPVCRSLDGTSSVADPARRCDACSDHDACTPQVRLDLVVDGRPYRLLLAFTSARNFIAYKARLDSMRVPIDIGMHELVVIPRGTWGEVTFREAR